MKKLTREAIGQGVYYMGLAMGQFIPNDAKERLIDYFEENGYLEKPLTFEKIRKECISGETVLVDTKGNKLTFIGFYNGEAIIGNCSCIRGYKESDIANWRIKK